MTPIPKPPAWIDSLIERLAPLHLAEEIQGDLYELYLSDLAAKDIAAARRKYIWNALGFLLRRFFWKRNSVTQNNIIMLRSYFTMAHRSLLAYKSNTFINIIGLTIGIASALTILTFIRYELSFDSFHTNHDNIYRMVRVGGKDMSEFRTGISYPVPWAMKDEITSFRNISAMEYFGGALMEVPDANGNIVTRYKEMNGLAMVEPSFFKMFDFGDKPLRWLQGNPEKALVEPFSVVLTESIAKKYFGDDENIVGRTLRFEKDADCKVTGVISDFPDNTDFPFTVLLSYSTVKVINKRAMDDWNSVSDDHYTFVELPDNMTQEEAEAQIARVHERHTPGELHRSRHYLLQRLADVHFQAQFGNYKGRTISKPMILAMSLVALFLLLTSCINYINLATAQSAMRSKEIGLRKVLGSHRGGLISQLLTETFVVVLAAGVVALALSEILLWNLQSLLNLHLQQYNFTDPFILGALGLIIVTVTFFAGLYPSLVVSRINTVNALKSKFATETVGGFSFRKVLVVVQFTATQVLVVSAFIIVSQMKFFQNRDMGFNQEAIVVFPLPERDSLIRQTIEDRLRAESFVSNVSFSYTLPSGVNRRNSARDIWRGGNVKEKNVIFEYQAADSSYLNVFGIKLLAGRNLNEQDAHRGILVTKQLAEHLGFATPEEAVGEEVMMVGEKVSIVGVVNDYYNQSLKADKGDIVITPNPKSYGNYSVKLQASQNTESLKQAMAKLERIWKESFPEHIYEYRFFDENVKAYYEQEEKYARLFQLFAMVFLLIGCLGLYGLIAFVVNRKSKEVAIRKVLGATIRNILVMFSKEYVQLIALSFILAVPAAYYTVNNWLNNFRNHVALSWWMFVLPGLLVLIIAVLVVILKSLKVVQANPMEKLKYE